MVESVTETRHEEGSSRADLSRPHARWIAVVALVAIVCVVFLPALRFEFIDFDVPDQIVNNPYVHGLSAKNLWHVFTSRCISSYYPVRTLSFAVDYQVWGLEATGFKLTNMVIHLVNVLLVYWLFLRVLGRDETLPTEGNSSSWGVFSAAYAAGLFAVHPLVVEPVVWVPGREELLMTLGALGTVHCHLSARAWAERGGASLRVAAWHVAAALCCLLACLSNAVGAIIPLLVTACDLLYLHTRRISRTAAGTAALWCIGVATIVVKRIGYVEHPTFAKADALDAVMESLGHGPGQTVVGVDLFSWQHIGLVLRVFWLNVSSVFWPRDLTVSYDPIVPPSIWHVEVWLGALGLIAFLLVAWLVRSRRELFLGMLWFGIALAPVSQIMPHHIHRADRFLYLPLIGVSMGLAALLARVSESTWRRGLRRGIVVLCVIGGLVTVVTTVDQVTVWQNNFSLWRHAVGIAPRNCVAHRRFADELAEAGEFEEASRQYRHGLQINVYDAVTLDHYSRFLATAPAPYRDCDLAIRLAGLACELTSWSDMAVLRTLAIAHNNRADWLRQEGEFVESLNHYALASEKDPDYLLPLLNRALLLAICEDETVRNLEEAVRLAKVALEKSTNFSIDQLVALAEIFRLGGYDAVARDILRQAREQAEIEGRKDVARQLQLRLDRVHSQPADQDEM